MILNWRLVVIWQAVFALFSISASASGSDLFERPPFETITIPRHEEDSLRLEEVMLAWHPDGKTLAIVQEENIEAWDMIKGKFIKRITVKKGETQTLKLGARFLENGKTLVVGGYRVDMNSSHSINLFNSKYRDQTVLGSAYSSMCDAISYENKKDNKVYIATCVHRAEESKINLWQAKLEYTQVKIWAVTQDGEKVLIAGDEEVSWYNLKSGVSEDQLKLDKHKSEITRHSTNPNSTILATGDRDGLICTWDLRSMKLLNVLRAHLDSVNDIAFSADGKTLYGVSGKSLTVWDVESGKKKAAISVGGAAIAPSPDGKAVAVVTWSGIVELVDWASSRKKGRVGLAYRDYQGKEETEISINQLGWYSCPNPIIGVSSNGYYRMNQDDSVVEAKKFAIGSFGGYYSVLNSHSPRICYANEKECAVFDLINGETEKIWGFDNSLKKLKRTNLQARPIQTVRQLLYNPSTSTNAQINQAWNPKTPGTSQDSGAYWLPYENLDFVTPPFPDFCSGHATFGAVSARLFNYLLGQDSILLNNPVSNLEILGSLAPILAPNFSNTDTSLNTLAINNVFCYPGCSTIQPNPGFNGNLQSPLSAVVLNYSTWNEMSIENADSREYGGVHYNSSNKAGLLLGTQIADKIWGLYKNL